MEQARYASRLRYLDAQDVDDSYVDFDGLDVRGRDNEKLGDTDGFIVNADSGRVFYVVVDSGGWFTSQRFLIPVGHATVDRDQGALRVDLSKDSLKRYPEFDRARFEEFSNEDLRAFDRRMAEACCPDEPFDDVSAEPSYFETRRHYAEPAWWGASSVSRERLRPVEIESTGSSTPPRERYDRELVTARERDTDIDTRRDDRDRDVISSRELDERAAGDDVSPHFGGRAQPGDVLGVETGGERTYMGDTGEDENKRRRDAERDARRDEEDDRRSDR
jgi:hypothetical protein